MIRRKLTKNDKGIPVIIDLDYPKWGERPPTKYGVMVDCDEDTVHVVYTRNPTKNSKIYKIRYSGDVQIDNYAIRYSEEYRGKFELDCNGDEDEWNHAEDKEKTRVRIEAQFRNSKKKIATKPKRKGKKTPKVMSKSGLVTVKGEREQE